MEAALLRDLVRCETDIDGVKDRFCGNESLYVSCLSMFLEDQTMRELKEALCARSWDEAFTAAHALKGVAGNMGFVPLYHAAASLVVLIRSGKTQEIEASYQELSRCYEQIASVLRGQLGAK